MPYRQFYEDEMAGREQARAAAATPVTIVTVFAGLIAFYVREFPSWSGLIGGWFFVAIACAAAFLGLAVYALIKSLHGYEYERIPTPQQVRDYETGLRQYYVDIGDEPSHAEGELNEWLRERYAKAAERNARNNLEKSRHLFSATSAIVYCLVALAVALPPFLITGWRTPAEPVRVEVLGVREILSELYDDRYPQDAAESGQPVSGSGDASAETDTSSERGVQGRPRDP